MFTSTFAKKTYERWSQLKIQIRSLEFYY